MKTTLNISDVTMREVKLDAARRRQTMSAMVEAALRTIVEPEQRKIKLPPLPEFGSGGLRVNVANAMPCTTHDGLVECLIHGIMIRNPSMISLRS